MRQNGTDTTDPAGESRSRTGKMAGESPGNSRHAKQSRRTAKSARFSYKCADITQK